MPVLVAANVGVKEEEKGEAMEEEKVEAVVDSGERRCKKGSSLGCDSAGDLEEVEGKRDGGGEGPGIRSTLGGGLGEVKGRE